MRRRHAWLTCVPLVLLAGATPAIDPAERARQFDQWFLDGDGAKVVAAASPALQAALGAANQVPAVRDKLIGVGPTRLPPGGANEEVTVTRSVVTADGRMLRLTTTVDAAGTIIGFLVKPDTTAAALSSFLDYKTKAVARLPFEGTWKVVWGGRTIDQNYHAAYPDQRFAYDILIERGGRTHDRSGNRLADFYCYGQPVLAPAAGKVVATVGDLPDNVPGHVDPAHAAGNHVVLDLGQGEYAFLCHLQPGSLKVRVGDLVTPGRPVGLCGNSGNTTEPHVHIHLQTTATFGLGKGLPLQFQKYVADEKPVSCGEPTRGQQVRAE